MRPVLVGIDPKEEGREPLHPCEGQSGDRLAHLAGLDFDGFLETYDRVNLYWRPEDDPRPSRDAAAAENLFPLLRGRRVIALGNVVQDALGFEPGRNFEWRLVRGSFVGVGFPHPSGRNHFWNDANNRRAAEVCLRLAQRPCVHVEGPDGAGKSWLVQQLSGLLGMRVTPTDGPPDSWIECMRRIQRRLVPGRISDRSSGLVSELVYGPVIRGGTLAEEDVIWAALRAVLHHVTFVYCRPPRCAVVDNHERRPGESIEHVEAVEVKIDRLIDRYDDVFDRICQMGGRVFRYDWTSNQRPEDIARCVGS